MTNRERKLLLSWLVEHQSGVKHELNLDYNGDLMIDVLSPTGGLMAHLWTERNAARWLSEHYWYYGFLSPWTPNIPTALEEWEAMVRKIITPPPPERE